MSKKYELRIDYTAFARISANLFKALAALSPTTITTDKVAVLGEASFGIIDGIFEMIIIEQTKESLLSVLFVTAVYNAYRSIILENKVLLRLDANSKSELSRIIDEKQKHFVSTIGHLEIELDLGLLEDPLNTTAYSKVRDIFEDWLKLTKANAKQAKSIANQLRGNFIFELYQEWIRNQIRYTKLADEIQSPFYSANEKEKRWKLYQANLHKQVSLPVLSSEHSLESIYVDLNIYYYFRDKENKNLTIKVMDAKKALDNWVLEAHKDDAVRVIQGGPGSGKSSFAKMYAVSLAKDNYNVLLIKCEQLEIGGVFDDALKRYVLNTGWFKENDLFNDDKTIIILDGLDEIARQGEVAARKVTELVNSILVFIKQKNNTILKVLFLLTGRDTVVQAIENAFTNKSSILHLLSYLPNNEELDKNCKVEDVLHKLSEDKRLVWWRKYNGISGDIGTLPAYLQHKQLEALTVIPLLNYLVFITYGDKELDELGKISICRLYSDLLSKVYERAYDENRRHGVTKNIELDDFKITMEEIAISAWRGSVKTTTVNEVKNRCEESSYNIKHEFKDDPDMWSNLFVAFYFRRANIVGGIDTFEFTHKSFCEYLVAMRLIRLESEIYNQFSNGYYNIKECLLNWIKVCEDAAIVDDVYRFLADGIDIEFSGTDKEINVLGHQQLCVNMINYIQENGLPFEELNRRPEFRREFVQHINTQVILLAFCHRFAKISRQINVIKWETAGSLKLLIESNAQFKLNDCLKNLLSTLNLSNVDLKGVDLSRAHLEGIRLRGAHLSGALLKEANLRNADLVGVAFFGADLGGADLRGAKLSQANLQKGSVRNAKMNASNLTGTDFSGTDISETDFGKPIVWEHKISEEEHYEDFLFYND